MPALVDDSIIEAFAEDGAVVLRGAFTDWIETLASGVAGNEAQPGPYFAENVPPGEAGRFWDDYCNWARIKEFEQFVFESTASTIAAELMKSSRVQLFHEHVLVKDAHTPTATPWHSDGPYYFVDGAQTISFWIPLDPVDQSSLRLIRGSHRWSKAVLPVRWLGGADFYGRADDYLPVPDPDAHPDRYEIAEWSLQPGDAVAFNFRTVHGARGNLSPQRRRAFSVRFVGDDARYGERPGPTSPPFPDHGMVAGETLRSDWFPYVVGGAR